MILTAARRPPPGSMHSLLNEQRDGWSSRPDRRAPTRGAVWFALAVAALSILAWYMVVMRARPGFIGDEEYHAPTIAALAQGDWGPSRHRSMTPAYHYLASFVAHWWSADLSVLRGFNVVIGLLTLMAFHFAARGRNAPYRAYDVLRFAWHPILLPLWALVYTDVLSLLLVLAALALNLRRWHILAAVALIAATLVRQSNAVWLAMFAALAVLDAPPINWNPRGLAGRIARTWPRWLPYVVGGLLTITLAVSGILKVIPRSENGPRFNPAQLYLFFLLLAVWWAPAWIPAFVAYWRRDYLRQLLRPWPCTLTVAAVALVALLYANPHKWNVDPTFIRNWPLHTIAQHAWLRLPLGLVLVAFGVTVVQRAWSNPHRVTLAVIFVFTLLFLGPQYLVDPRYYIVSYALLDLFFPWTPAEQRRLAGWYLLCSVAVASLIAIRPAGTCSIW